jgi:hypothetical protein
VSSREHRTPSAERRLYRRRNGVTFVLRAGVTPTDEGR